MPGGSHDLSHREFTKRGREWTHAPCAGPPGIRVEVRATKGSARAVLCMRCHEGVVLEARLRAYSCDGCRSLASAFVQATHLSDGHLSVLVPRFPSHVSGCLGLGYRLHRTVPRPFAGWPQRRAWLVTGCCSKKAQPCRRRSPGAREPRVTAR